MSFLYCYICGGSYGSASVKRHIEACKIQFNYDQNLLPLRLQVTVPPQPSATIPPDLKDKKAVTLWNDAAWKSAQDARNHCPYCQRGFGSDKIVNHIRVCSKKPPNAEDLTVDKKTTSSKPVFFLCGICGREYGTTSIKIHLPTCLTQFHNDQQKIAASLRRAEPKLEDLLAVIDEIWADGKVTQSEIDSQRTDATSEYNASLAKCPNCGRTFESSSLEKHLVGCKTVATIAREFSLAKDPDAPIATPAQNFKDDEPDPESTAPDSGAIYIPVAVSSVEALEKEGWHFKGEDKPVFVIEDGEDGDVENAIRLQREAFLAESIALEIPDTVPMAQSDDDIALECRRDRCFRCVRGAEREMVGHIRADVRGDDEVFVDILSVSPRVQGHGVGTRLIRRLEAEFPGRRLWLYTCNILPRNVTFYERLGFTAFREGRDTDGAPLTYLEKVVPRS